MTARSESNEIHITRLYEAPVEVVWDAWTNPAKVAKWWGPRGFSLTTHSKDLRPGGHWAYTMHGPDGTDYPNLTKYLEVERCARLVYDHGSNDHRPPLFRVTVLFKEVKDKTRMEMTMTLATPQAAEEARRFIKGAGGDATWDRLGEYLIQTASGKEAFVINRSFQASVERMFEMWTDPDHFRRWLPPTGFTMEVLRGDVREGGTLFYVMKSKELTMYGRVLYRALRRPDRLVYEQQFTDEKERISRHPLAPVWPEAMLTRVTLTAEGPEQTRVTVLSEPTETATVAEIQAFVKERAGMTQGWTGSFDKLDARLHAGRQDVDMRRQARQPHAGQ